MLYFYILNALFERFNQFRSGWPTVQFSDSLACCSIQAYSGTNVIIAYEQSNVGPGGGWKQQTDGSWYYQKNGEMLKNCWHESEGKWYRFDESGKMLTGWQLIDGAQYYLTETADETHSLGSMYVSESTPDGNAVDADGKLVPKPEPTVSSQQTALETAASRINPYGNVSCVEISLGNQLVYAYSGTQCIFASPCVTGRVINGNATPAGMLMYGKEASNRKQEIDRQHYTIPNQRPKDKHCGKI